MNKSKTIEEQEEKVDQNKNFTEDEKIYMILQNLN